MSWPLVQMSDTYLGLFDGPHGTPRPAVDGRIFLGIGNITEDGHLDLSGARRIADDQFAQWTKRVTPRPGDIVFTYEATLNRYAIIPEGFDGCLGRRVALIRHNPKVADYRFLFYSFFSKEWRETIERNRLSGATVDRVPLSHFPKFPIRLPPLPVQRRIADILSAYDGLIENNARRIAILEGMACRLFEEWFGRETESQDAKPVRIDSMIDFDPRTKVSKDGLKPFLPMPCVPTNSMVVSEWEAREGNAGSKFLNGDTLLARITPCLENGKTAFVDFLPEGEAGFGSTEFIVMRGRAVPPEFVYCLARSEAFREHAIKSMSGATGRQRVSGAAVAQFEMRDPQAEQLCQFGDTARPMFAMIRALANANTNLRTTRDLLLPKLVSGEIEVSAAEEALETAAA